MRKKMRRSMQSRIRTKRTMSELHTSFVGMGWRDKCVMLSRQVVLSAVTHSRPKLPWICFACCCEDDDVRGQFCLPTVFSVMGQRPILFANWIFCDGPEASLFGRFGISQRCVLAYRLYGCRTVGSAPLKFVLTSAYS